MQKNLIYIVLMLLTACNSTDETEYFKNQSNGEIKTESDSSNFHDADDSIVEEVDIVSNVLEGENEKVKSISDLWNTYKTSKAEAIKNFELGNLSLMIKNYETAANAAIDLSRNDLASWQLNNIGHFSIEEFSKETDYQNRLRTLAITGDQIKKEAYFRETKQIFRQNYQILLSAETYLLKASQLDKNYKYSERTKAINSNLKFINWIRKFLRDGLTQ